MSVNKLEKELAFDEILKNLFPDDLFVVAGTKPIDRDGFNKVIALALKDLQKSSSLQKGDLKPKMDKLHDSYLTIFRKSEEMNELRSLPKIEVEGFFNGIRELFKSFLVDLKIFCKDLVKAQANKSLHHQLHKVIDTYTDEKLSATVKHRVERLKFRFAQYRQRIANVKIDKDLQKVMSKVKPEKLNTETRPEFIEMKKIESRISENEEGAADKERKRNSLRTSSAATRRS